MHVVAPRLVGMLASHGGCARSLWRSSGWFIDAAEHDLPIISESHKGKREFPQYIAYETISLLKREG